MLAEAFVRGNPVDLPSLEDLTVNINIDISASRIKVIASRRDDGRYDLHDPLSKELAYSVESLGEVPGEVRLMPGFFMMTIDDFSKVANLDAELFEEHLNTLPPSNGTKDFMTNKLFDMLQAYDSGAVCAQELIDCCCILAESLRALMEDDVSVINCAQVRLRKGEPFDRNEIERIALTSSSAQAKASAYIILGNKSLAEKCLGLIPKKEREVYEAWPIYNLFVSNTAEREGITRKHR